MDSSAGGYCVRTFDYPKVLRLPCVMLLSLLVPSTLTDISLREIAQQELSKDLLPCSS
jgi:hypothetical protein